MLSKSFSAWLLDQKLLLASSSQTRRLLIESASIPVEMMTADVDERTLERHASNLSPAQLAVLLAEAKARAVASRFHNRIVVGADQTLDIGGACLHKPRDRAEAHSQIARLSGRTHRLHSAVAIARDGQVAESFVETAFMTFRDMTEADIASYMALASDDDVLKSVGAYRFEGIGIHLFSKVVGDHSTIMGLPMIAFLDRLRSMGLLRL